MPQGQTITENSDPASPWLGGLGYGIEKEDRVKRLPTSKIINPHQQLVQGWADWLNGMPWTFFVTFTVPYLNGISTTAAMALMNRTHESWKKMANGQCTFFYVTERNQLRDGHHMHALVWLPDHFTHPHMYCGLIDAYQAMVGAKVVRNDGGKLIWANGSVYDDFYGKRKVSDYGDRGRIDIRKFDKGRKAASYCLKYIMKASNGPGHYELLS